MALMEWREEFVLDVDQMDHTHREFVALVNQLADAPDSLLVAELDGFIQHTVEHFEQERRWMEETGFPPMHCHVGEHERVMDVLRDVRSRLEAGDTGIARTLIEEMPKWFANHAATMDAALAWYMKQHAAGNTPDTAAVACG